MSRVLRWKETASEDEDDEDDGEGSSLLHSRSGAASTATDEESEEAGGYIADDAKFKAATTTAIILNAIFMAVQVDNPEATPEILGFKIPIWFVIMSLFNAFFVVEIGLSLHAKGCKAYFCDPEEWAWNLFDVVVVFGGLAGYLITEVLHMRDLHDHEMNKGIGTSGSPGTYGRGLLLLRILRILRVLRVIRLFRSFSQLRMLARGLLESMKIVFWIFVLMFLIIFLSAIVCTTIIGQDNNCALNNDSESTDDSCKKCEKDTEGNIMDSSCVKNDDVYMYFGTVGRSMFTLFQFLTMDDWAAVERLVHAKMPFMRPFFFAFIFFGAFVLMSLLTGVMADHMNDVRQQEEEERHREKIHQREHAIQIATSVDVNGDGTLDRNEFQALLAHPAVAQDMHSAGVSLRPREARDMFEWFDVNGDGLIDNEELYHGLKHLFEGVTGLQMYKLKVAIKRATASAENGERTAPQHSRRRRPPPTAKAQAQLAELKHTFASVEAGMDAFESKVRCLMSTFGWPPEGDGGSPKASTHGGSPRA